MAKAVTVSQTELPANLAAKMDQDAGKGVSSDQADNLVPLIYVLQPLSPQIRKNSPAYIEGAQQGDILLRNAPNPIVKGEEGILFQPCYFTKDWVEWVPRDSGGGFVARHPVDPVNHDVPPVEGAVKQIDSKNKNKVRWTTPNGNELILTRYHVGYVFTANDMLPYVIPMTSTGHTVSRQWMFMMNSVKTSTGKKAPTCSKLYRLRTKEKTNAMGTWYTWDVQDAGWVPSERQYDLGMALHEAFAHGEKETDAPIDLHNQETSDEIGG